MTTAILQIRFMPVAIIRHVRWLWGRSKPCRSFELLFSGCTAAASVLWHGAACPPPPFDFQVLGKPDKIFPSEGLFHN